MVNSDTLLARNWKKSRVLRCHDLREGLELCRFLRERYAERFLDPIECLARSPGNQRGFGFAIMSLCCLMIETLECYRIGWPSSYHGDLRNWGKSSLNTAVPDSDYALQSPYDFNTYSSKQVFEKFFSDPKHQAFFPGVEADEFYKSIRCGLLHQAQTMKGWLIVRSGAFWHNTAERRSINRDEFSNRLRQCFDAFVSELEAANWTDPIGRNTRKKIWWLTQTS